MQKLFKHLLIAAFFVVLCLPLCIAAVQGINTDNMPELINSNKKLNTDFDTDMNEYVSENQPFYDSSVFFNNFIKSKVFKSETANVITGKNGYYFYSETKNDILHTDSLSEREIYNIAKNLELINEYCTQKGCKFVFTVAPNKGTVYPEYLPGNFKAAKGNSNLQALEKELENHDIAYAELTSVLSQKDKQTYLENDTHWNNYGALLAYSRIMQYADAEIPQVIANSDFSEKQDWHGDLSAMLFKENAEKGTQYYSDALDEIENSIRVRIRGEKSRKSDELISKIASTTENYTRIDASSSVDNGNGSLFMLRDSFCRSMFPYFAYSFSNSKFFKSSTYDAYVNPMDDYDCFVFEIVERNIDDILENEQTIPAPKRNNITVKSDMSKKKQASVDISNEYADYTIVQGNISSDLLRGREDIFVKVIDSQTGESNCYEAFPGKRNKNTYAYFLTTNDLITENSEIQIIVNNTVVAKTSV